MITIAIIGVVVAIALPAYRAYVDTANMSKVNSAYENAISVIQQEFKKHEMKVSIGLVSTLPTTSDEWIGLLDPGEQTQAPGGGPIYTRKNKKHSNADVTGAIRVVYNDKRGRVDVYRPEYLDLTPLRARITTDSIKIKKM